MTPAIKNVWKFLHSTRTRDMAIKTAIIAAFTYVALLFWWTRVAAIVLIAIFTICEKNTKSILYPCFFMNHQLNVSPIPITLIFVFYHLAIYIYECIKKRERPDMLFWLITAFAAYCVIISFILYMPPVKSDTFYYGRKNAPYMYTSVLALFALYIMLKKREIKIRDIAIFSVAGLVAGFLIGLSYYFFSWTEYVFTYPPRYKAISSQPTFLSRSAGTAAALLCLWYLKKPFNLYFFSSLFAVVGVVGLSSGTRAFLIAYVMFFVAFYGYLLFKHQKRTAISAGVSIAFLITLFIVLGFIFEESRKLLIGKMDIMATERAYDPDALDPGRLGLWKRYITDWVSNPLTFFFGRGFLWWDTLGVGTHNSVLHLLHKTGLIGFALCMTIYIMFLLRALDLKNIKSQIMPLVFFFMYCAVFLMVDTTITRPDFLFMCLGLFLVMYVPPAGADTDKTLPTGEGTKSTTSKSEKQKSDV